MEIENISHQAHTFIPFIYLFIVSNTFGRIYHAEATGMYQPYVVLIFFIVNSFVYSFRTHPVLIKNIVHYHIWKTCTYAVFAVLLNHVHIEMFAAFHFVDNTANFVVSCFYIFFIVLQSYLYRASVNTLFYTNMAAAFVPLGRVWEINLYMFVVFTSCSIVLTFMRYHKSKLVDPSMHWTPVVRYFMYLRVHDYLVVAGVLQLGIEYYTRIYDQERAALDDIDAIVDARLQKIEKRRRRAPK